MLCGVVPCCAVLCCAVLCRAVLWWRGGGGSSCAVSGPFWPDTHPVQPAGPQRGPCLGLPHRLAELLAGGLPVTPRVTATPKPCPTWAELAGVAREGTRGVVWCGVVWCGVAWRGVVRRGVARRGAVRGGAGRGGVVWFGVVWCAAVRCGAGRGGAVWCGVVWCGVVWRRTMWWGVMQCYML